MLARAKDATPKCTRDAATLLRSIGATNRDAPSFFFFFWLEIHFNSIQLFITNDHFLRPNRKVETFKMLQTSNSDLDHLVTCQKLTKFIAQDESVLELRKP